MAVEQKAVAENEPAPVSVELARLEYGKVCVEPDGPIEEGVEHSQLGWSANLRKELIPVCKPNKLNISTRELEPLPSGCEHGTALRPVIAVEGRPPLPLMYCVRNRPQDGEGGRARTFTMARYVIAPKPNFDPLRLFGAVKSAPMRGLTRNDLKAPLPPLLAPPASGLTLDEMTDRFLAYALIYIHSGVPISVTGDVAEGTFFKWVSALWRLSHPALRPYLSAGWGVGASLAGRLAVSYATHPADNCAIFSCPEGKWKHPLRYVNRVKGQTVLNNFSGPFLDAGSSYVKRVFVVKEGAILDPASYDSSFERQQLKESPPQFQLGALPDFNDPALVRWFRVSGLQAQDEFVLHALKGGLQSGRTPLPDSVDVTFPDSRREAFELASRFQGDDDARARADKIIWKLLENDVDYGDRARFDAFLKTADHQGASRGRLFSAIQHLDAERILDAIYEAALAGEASGLPERASEKLKLCLDEAWKKIDRRKLDLHAHIIERDPEELPGAYREWLRRNPFDFVLMLIQSGKSAEEVRGMMGRAELASPALEAMCRQREGEPPHNEDIKAIQSMAPVHRSAFVGYLINEWNQSIGPLAVVRDRLLPWLDRVLPPTPQPEEPYPGQELIAASDPLIKLYRGQDFTLADAKKLCDEVESNRVPESLFDKIAVLALRNLDFFEPRMFSGADDSPGRQRWKELVARRWPEEVFYALYWKKNGVLEFPEKIKEAMRQSKRQTIDLQDSIEQFCHPDHEARLEIVARMLWTWAVNSDRVPLDKLAAVDICRALGRGEMPSSVCAPKAEQIDIAMRLIRACGLIASSKGTKSPFQEYALKWRSSLKQDWQLPLYLELFPEEYFDPKPNEINWLVKRRAWLKRHLDSPGIHPERKKQLEILTCDFLSRSRVPDEFKKWCEQTVIWAVFRDAPQYYRKHPGCLGEALDHYAEEGGYGKKVHKAKLCRDYLKNNNSNEFAAEQALSDFILPALREANVPADQWKHLFKQPINAPWYLQDLINDIYRNCTDKFYSKVIAGYLKK